MSKENPKEVFNQEFLEALVIDNTIASVILTHTYIERHLYAYIKTLIGDAAILENRNFTYQLSVLLSLDLGLRPDLAKPLNYLGKIRNKFAHTLKSQITKGDAKEFYSQFSSKGKTVIQENIKKMFDSGDLEYDTIKNFNPRSQFILCCATLNTLIKVDIEHLSIELAQK